MYDTNIFENCTFLFSFCHPLTDIEKCENSSVCQWSMERPDDIFKLGEFIYDPFYEKGKSTPQKIDKNFLNIINNKRSKRFLRIVRNRRNSKQ